MRLNFMHRFLPSMALATALVFGVAPQAGAQEQSQAPPVAGAARHPHRRPGQPPNTTPGAAPVGAPVPGTQLTPLNGAPQREHLPLPRATIASPSVSPKNAAGEEFFIVASIDQTRSQILLKHPTEVTELMQLTPNTKYLDENGKPAHLQDFRAGDTVWALSSGGGVEPKAVRIRKGQMTVADLHRYYLDYPEIK
jgi:hypothetical protein